MASGQELQYITLDDFSPGILEGKARQGFSAGAPNGAAQIQFTQGCILGQDGKSLVPGPARLAQTVDTPFDLPLDTLHYPDPTFGGIGAVPGVNITSFRVLSPTFITAVGQKAPQRSDAIFVIFQWWWDAGGTGLFQNAVQKAKFKLYKTFIPATYDIFVPAASAAAGASASVGYSKTSIDFSRANNAAPTLPGNPFALGIYSDLTQAVAMQRAYPAQATPGTDSSDSLAAVMNNAFYAWAHQDRIIFTRPSGNELLFGSGSQTVDPESLNATNTNNYSAAIGPSIFVAENPTGIGSWVSMNSSTLVIFKRNGGAYMLSGSFEQPTITRLPGVPSADAPNLGVITPDGGYVYGNNRGVWEWSGGDSSNLLSAAIEGPFWTGNQYTQHYLGHVGSFTYCYPFLVAPGGNYSGAFLFDMQNPGWWRLGDPTLNLPSYTFCQANDLGQIFLAPAIFTNTAPNNSVCDIYAFNFNYSVVQNWIWRSHALSQSVNRELDIREVSVTAYAGLPGNTGTITVTLYAQNKSKGGHFSQGGATFTIPDSTYPTTQSATVDCQGGDVIVDINATTAGSTAPSLVRLTVGYVERQVAR